MNDKWSNIGQTEGEDAKPHAHILYGALVGGPDQKDSYSDKIGDYQYTEVAIDYNAGYTAALCAMVESTAAPLTLTSRRQKLRSGTNSS